MTDQEPEDHIDDGGIDAADLAFTKVQAGVAARNIHKPERPALGFILLMLVLAGFMALLGFWQVQRLDEKQHLVARIQTRMTASPRTLPPLAEWAQLDPEVWDYRPAKLTGTFLHEQTMFVFTNLTDAKGPQSGPGYWVIAPFLSKMGGTVLVNRGFIPQDARQIYADGGVQSAGEVTISGIARAQERANAFTPGPDFSNRIDWIVNVERLEKMLHPAPEHLAPFYFDQSSTNPEILPQAGETKLTLNNRHTQYAITWFSLSAITIALLGYWVFSRRKK